MLILNAALAIKILIGVLVIILIQILSGTSNYYIAALVPLFPFFGIISYYIIGTERDVIDLRTAIVFGIFSLIPYFVFLISLYIFTRYYKISYSLALASIFWTIAALILIYIWNSIIK